MALKKLPSEVTIEELLASLEQASSDAPQVEDSGDDVVNFMQAVKIEPGNRPVRSDVLYKIYKHWSQNPVSNITFSTRVGQYIRNKNTYFLIAHNPVDITKLKITLKPKKKHHRVSIKSFTDFFAYNDIKPGTVSIESFVLYYLYEEYCDKFKHRRKQSLARFTLALKAFFEWTHSDNVLKFKISEDIFKYLPDTKLKALRKGRRKYNVRTKKEKQT